MNKKSIMMMMALAAGAAFADAPMTINYVGYLEGVSSSGTIVPLSEKSIMMAFRLYDGPGKGLTVEKQTALWGRQSAVALTDGAFSVDLSDNFGSVLDKTKYTSLADAIVAAVDRGCSDLYIGITPANDANAEIYPRQKLTAVPKAVQAAYVRKLPDDFTATNGTFQVAGELAVTGGAELSAAVTYENAAFEPSSQTTFAGGVTVDGTLRAHEISATTVKADAVSADALATSGNGALCVTGRLDAAGTPVWNGSLNAPDAAVKAEALKGKFELKNVTVKTLQTKNFVNNGSLHLDENREWNVIGPLVTDAVKDQAAGNCGFYCWSPTYGKNNPLTSILVGSWKAPCDCIAYFQVEVVNQKNELACVQFYVVEDPKISEFSEREPAGVATIENPGTLKTCVPVVLQKGETVKWVGYNHNINESVGIAELEHSKVTAVRYQSFGW